MSAESVNTGTRSNRPQRYVVARVDEIPPGERLIVEVGGREVGVFNLRGEFYAMLNRCPHVGGPLCRGQIVSMINSTGQGEISIDDSTDLLTCPWHNWEFDLKTGQSYWDPENLRARSFGVGVEQGDAVSEDLESGVVGRVKGPYQAETVDVAVEADYVVLSLRPQRRRPVPPGACGAPTESTPCQPSTTEEVTR